MVHVAKRDSDNPARIYTSPTTPFISSTATGWLWSNTIRTAYGTRPTGTHFEQPVDDRSRAATMFAPQGHTMHQPHLQGHYDVPAPMQIGTHNTSLTSRTLDPTTYPTTASTTTTTTHRLYVSTTSHFHAPATVITPTPTHAYIPQQQQQHQPPPPQQQPPQANFTFPTTLTPTTVTLQPCTIPMQVASPVPVSATPQTATTTASNSRKPPQQPAPQQLAQGVAPAPATGGTSAAVTTDPDQRGTLPPPLAPAAAAIPALIADLRSADKNNDSSPAHLGSDAAEDTQSIASPEHHVAPPATLQNNHVGNQENKEAAHRNLEPSAWTPDPGAVPHPLSCYAATQPSTDVHEVCHSRTNVKIDGITELISRHGSGIRPSGFGFRNSGGLRRIECYNDSDFRRGPRHALHPLEGGHSPTVRHTAARSAARCLQLRLRPRDRRPDCRKIMLEDVCRPSSIKRVIGGTNKEIPGCHLRIGNTRHQGATGSFGNRDRTGPLSALQDRIPRHVP